MLCPPSGRDFAFAGYALVEADGQISALTNCRGFPKASQNAELSPCGLLPSLDRARDVQAALRAHEPDSALDS